MSAKLLCSQVEHFRVKRLTIMSDFKQLVAQKWQVPVDRQRYWHWATRQNHSVRVSSPLGAESDNVKVCDIRVGSDSSLVTMRILSSGHTAASALSDNSLLCAPLPGS